MGISGPEKTSRSRINSTLEPCVSSDVSALWYEETLNHHAAGGYSHLCPWWKCEKSDKSEWKKITLTELRWGENSLELLHLACFKHVESF